jgi:tryptophan-rich sensory protein
MKNLMLAILCGIVGALFTIVQVFGVITTGEPNSFGLLITGLGWIGFAIYFNNYRQEKKKTK